jgi:hypothetical protein
MFSKIFKSFYIYFYINIAIFIIINELEHFLLYFYKKVFIFIIQIFIKLM